MPKSKKKSIKVKVRDQRPTKDPKGGGKHHHKRGEQTAPIDPPVLSRTVLQ